MGVITYNGKRSTDYGIISEVIPSFDLPEKQYESIEVPGRNGNLIIDNQAYKNVKRTYYLASASSSSSFQDLANNISRWLNSASGYARLEDDYDPNCYRMASFLGGITINNLYNQAARVTVEFDCMPQRFLKTGEQAIVLEGVGADDVGFQITNPTDYISRPLIKFYQASYYNKFDINSVNLGYALFASNKQAPYYYDSSIKQAYYYTQQGVLTRIEPNRFYGYDKEICLLPGVNNIHITNTNGGGSTSDPYLLKVEVTPRWWTI